MGFFFRCEAFPLVHLKKTFILLERGRLSTSKRSLSPHLVQITCGRIVSAISFNYSNSWKSWTCPWDLYLEEDDLWLMLCCVFHTRDFEVKQFITKDTHLSVPELDTLVALNSAGTPQGGSSSCSVLLCSVLCGYHERLQISVWYQIISRWFRIWLSSLMETLFLMLIKVVSLAPKWRRDSHDVTAKLHWPPVSLLGSSLLMSTPPGEY